jgi:protease I
MMTGNKILAGKRIAVLATDGFEKEELNAPVAALKAAGADVEIVSLHPGRIRGMNVHQPAELVRVDKTVSDARARDYDGLLIPGGYISPDQLRQSTQVRDFVRDFNSEGRPIATLSHAPLVLASAGLVGQRTLTSSAGARDDMVNAGATWLDQDVVRQANWLTGCGLQTVAKFVPEMMQLFAGAPDRNRALNQAHSDPQRQAPSELPGQSLRWLSTPSVGTMLSLALVGVGVMAATRGRGKEDKPAASPE